MSELSEYDKQKEANCSFLKNWIDPVHIHCLNCFISQCSYKNCNIVQCCYCFVRTHSCKVEDHHKICLKNKTQCPNASYGCVVMISRDKISHHLKRCSANIISCRYIWYRNFINDKSKHDFESINDSNTLLHESNDLDVQLVYNDQVSQINVYNTCCKECITNPGSQHLHTLGPSQLSPYIVTNKKKNSKSTNLVISKFDKQNCLFMEMDHFCDFEFDVNSFRLEFQRGCYVCQRVVRRDEFSFHQLYHSQIQAFVPGQIVQRCPMSDKGCDFVTSALIPRYGKLRYNSFLEMIVHENYSENIFSKIDLTQKIIQTISIIEKYLDSTSIKCLAATNSRIYKSIFYYISHRLMIETIWKRHTTEKNKWKVEGFRHTLSSVQSPIDWIIEPSGKLSEHLKICPLNVTKCYKVDKVRLFPVEDD